MSSRRPRGINVVVIGLLFNALVYLFFEYKYLTIQHDPLSYFLEGSYDSFLSGLPYIISGEWDKIQFAYTFSMIIYGFYYQWLTGLLVDQIVFYALLIASIPILIWGLLRMRNWARIATITYSIIILVFIIVTILPSFMGYRSMGFVDLLYIGTSELYSFFHFIVWMTTLLVSGIAFSVYLSLDKVKYKFK